jgi:hypothetical protein
MIYGPFLRTFRTALVCCGVAIPNAAHAQLPALEDKPWTGHFVGYENRSYTFGFTSLGKGKFEVIASNGRKVSFLLAPSFNVVIEETMPDGKVVSRQIVPDSLESDQEATTKPDKIEIRGKTTGDATFVLQIEENRGTIQFGGRITDPGTLTKNPIRLVLRFGIPSIYAREKDTESKAFENKTKKDEIRVRGMDGRRVKIDPFEALDASGDKATGKGLTTVELEMAGYQGRKLEWTSTGDAKIELWNRTPGPLHSGFSINWAPDPEKDSQNAARISFTVR